MKRGLAILGALLITTGFLVWWFSTEQVLKRRATSMIETAQVPATMSDAGRKARGTHVRNYLAKQVMVEPPEDFNAPISGRVDRDTAAGLYSGAAAYSKEITFTDLKIDTITVNEDQAEIRFHADAIVALPTRRPIDGILHVVSQWREQDGVWLLTEFTWTESPR